MGILETIYTLDLSDEVKDKLRQEHASDLDPLKTERDSLKAQTRQQTVEDEVRTLAELGFSETPGLLKFYRRVLLSPDAEEPGAVLLLFSRGLMEAHNRRSEFGIERVRKLLAASDCHNAEGLCTEILDSVLAHMHGRAIENDLSTLALIRTAAAAQAHA